MLLICLLSIILDVTPPVSPSKQHYENFVHTLDNTRTRENDVAIDAPSISIPSQSTIQDTDATNVNDYQHNNKSISDLENSSSQEPDSISVESHNLYSYDQECSTNCPKNIDEITEDLDNSISLRYDDVNEQNNQYDIFNGYNGTNDIASKINTNYDDSNSSLPSLNHCYTSEFETNSDAKIEDEKSNSTDIPQSDSKLFHTVQEITRTNIQLETNTEIETTENDFTEGNHHSDGENVESITTENISFNELEINADDKHKEVAPLETEFNADFSQFASFESAPTNFTDQPNEKHENDTFQSNPIESTIVECDDDNDDDEFGEFSDFQQTTPAISSINTDNRVMEHIENIKREFSVVLASLFPKSESGDSFIGCGTNELNCETSIFLNEVTVHLRNVEESKAIMNHSSWKKSISKSFLVKALGIDQRNIVRNSFFFLTNRFDVKN